MSQHATPVKTEIVDLLQVKVYENRGLLGKAAGNDVSEKMKELLAGKERIRMVFAAAPSQHEFLDMLSRAEGIDWSRVTAFHMDEYIGLPGDASQKFGNYLNDHLFNIVKPGEVQLIDSSNSIAAECKRYGDLIKKAAIDIVCLGIGENGHIAFNDPPVADFDDSEVIKPVELNFACKQQQVNDGCFSRIDDVPAHALTLTIPALMSGDYLFCIVPGPTKREAVKRCIHGPVSTDCPASILRRHSNCILYVDTDSYEV